MDKLSLQELEMEIRIAEEHIKIEFNIDPHYLLDEALIDLSNSSFELFKLRKQKIKEENKEVD